MSEPRKHKAVFELFLEACELEPDRQAAFLDDACGSNQALRDEVEALLAQARARSGGSGAPTAKHPSGGADETIEAARRPERQAPNSRVRVQTPHPSGINIEGYQIVGELGRGGMGVVYEALQVKLNRHVALKILPAMPGATNLDAVARFRREATAAAKLHHSGIVPIYDFGQSGHTYYYAMEVVNGRPLNEMIRRFSEGNAASASQRELAELLSQATALKQDASDGAPPSAVSSASSASHPGSGSASRGRVYYRQVARWMSEAAEALNYAHSQGIIHRDVKPGNLMLSRDGHIMILDFGLAKSTSELSVTMTGSLLGTLRYMSPEQAMAKRMKVDHRTDIYSLGATMYELLTFQPAFQGRDEKETLGQIITKEPTPPRKIASHVPRELETICLKTLEKDAGARYATAQDLADDLRRYVQDLPIVAKPLGPVGRAMKYLRRHKAEAITALVVVLLFASIYAGKTILRMHRANLYFEEANIALESKEYGEAFELFDKAVQLEPDHQEARKLRRICMSQMPRGIYPKDLKEDLNRPENEVRIEGLIGVGIIKWKNRDFEGAAEAFSAARQIDPDNYRVLGNFASLKREQYAIRHDPRFLDEANDLLDHALYVHPNRSELWNIKGVVLRIRGRVQEAIAAHQRGVEENPGYYANWVSMANAYALNRQLEKAESSLRTATDLIGDRGSIMPWYNLAAVQLQLGKADAVASLKMALRISKSNASTQLLLRLQARAYLWLPTDHGRDPKQALTAAITADGLNPTDHPDAIVKRYLALARLRNAHWADAAAAAQSALDAGDTLAAYPHLILAIAEAQRGHSDQARKHLQLARDTWPAKLQKNDYQISIPSGFLWFESADELNSLRDEAQAILPPNGH